MHHLAESKSLLSAAPQLVLASTSRYRKELLSRLNLPFSVLAPGVDETPETNEVPKALALRLSLAKARAVARTLETDVTRQPNLIKTDCIIIGSDQTN